jgi:hypothetical protein
MGYSYGSGGSVAQLNAVKPLGLDPGSYGWSVQDAEGGGAPSLAAAVSYRSSYGTVQAGATANSATSSGSLELRGSIATMGGDVFLSNWIDDGFGVVSTGAPGVGVLYENQPVGVTDSKGMLLVPTLRSYESNNVAIDPTNLPADAEVESTSQIVAPANHGGCSSISRSAATQVQLSSFSRKPTEDLSLPDRRERSRAAMNSSSATTGKPSSAICVARMWRPSNLPPEPVASNLPSRRDRENKCVSAR